MPERDRNKESARAVEKIAGSEPVRGEDLVWSEATMRAKRNRTSRKKPQSEVLRYVLDSTSRSTLYRHYLTWRAQQNPLLPMRCDMPGCFYHTQSLTWNDKPFKPILDHIDGNSSDHRPHMLRLLCPTCDAQLETRGGANRGKIEKATGGFAKVRNGKRQYVLPIETGYYKLALGAS
jgi:hypothetical protein